MLKKRKHLACRVGDHSGGPVRGIAPNCTPLTLFTEDGAVWFVSDLDTHIIRAARRCARKDGVSVDFPLSAAIVEGFTRLVEGGAL